MTGRPVARRTRTPITTRRTRPIRRASAGLSTARAGAALAMLVSAAAVYGVGASPAFDYVRMEVNELHFTDARAVEAALAGARGENLFRLPTGPLQAELERFPTVAHARVDVRLPGTLAVTLDERVPVLIWQVGDQRYLADADGSLFALLAEAPPPEAAALPVVDDRRAESAGLSVGSRLDPVDLDAATRLARLVPADAGSSAVSLDVAVTDENGFVVANQARRLVGRLRVLHAEPADDGAHPGAGPAAAQPADRSRSDGRAGHPRVGDRRDVRAPADAIGEPQGDQARREVAWRVRVG